MPAKLGAPRGATIEMGGTRCDGTADFVTFLGWKVAVSVYSGAAIFFGLFASRAR